MRFPPISRFRSPHFSPQRIPVEFVALHYTGLSFEGALNIFLGKTEVSCHLLIDLEGRIFELVPCWSGFCQKAFHGGPSRWKDPEGKIWKNFNNFSIGVELVNFNGNLFPYTEKQYQTLFRALKHLKKIYPQLKKPWRIIGHEHIAGFRGKKDPGLFFQWKKLYKNVFGVAQPPPFSPALSAEEGKALSFCKTIYGNDKLSQTAGRILEKRASFADQKKLLKKALKNRL